VGAVPSSVGPGVLRDVPGSPRRSRRQEPLRSNGVLGRGRTRGYAHS